MPKSSIPGIWAVAMSSRIITIKEILKNVFSHKNLRKNELESLRKTPTKGIPPVGPGPTGGQFVLTVQPNSTKQK